MKKILFILTCLSLGHSEACNLDITSNFDKGLIYSGSKFPQSAANSIDTININDLIELKKGESTATNILGLIETGNASIEAAAKNGNITKIHYVDTKIEKVYIPLLFIPIYAKEVTTIVYGEE